MRYLTYQLVSRISSINSISITIITMPHRFCSRLLNHLAGLSLAWSQSPLAAPPHTACGWCYRVRLPLWWSRPSTAVTSHRPWWGAVLPVFVDGHFSLPKQFLGWSTVINDQFMWEINYQLVGRTLNFAHQQSHMMGWFRNQFFRMLQILWLAGKHPTESIETFCQPQPLRNFGQLLELKKFPKLWIPIFPWKNSQLRGCGSGRLLPGDDCSRLHHFPWHLGANLDPTASLEAVENIKTWPSLSESRKHCDIMT